MYILDKLYFFNIFNTLILSHIGNHIDNDIIALDRKFFPTTKDITDLIETTLVGVAATFIIYNFEKYEELICVNNKHIIHQYNFEL
jgi:hypothetical protein